MSRRYTTGVGGMTVEKRRYLDFGHQSGDEENTEGGGRLELTCDARGVSWGMVGETEESGYSFSATPKTMDGIELREIRAINVLVCVLNFHDLETAGPALRHALREIFDVTQRAQSPGNRGMTRKKRRLKKTLIDLGMQARREEPSDQVVVSRMMPYQGKAPRLVGWEHDLFRQLSAEFDREGRGLFAEWAIERAGLAAPQGSGMRGVVVLRANEEDGTREATLSRYAKAA